MRFVTTLIVEVVYRYGEVVSRVDVAEVDGRSSNEREGADEKVFHGEEYVPARRSSAPGRRFLQNLTTRNCFIKICRNRRRGRRQQLPSPRRQPGSHC